MRLRIEAIRALRLNYTRRGVYIWLKGRSGRPQRARWPYMEMEPVKLFGWQRLIYEPELVRNQHEAIAEGNCS